MTVFKGFMKIVKRNYFMILMYMGIFIGISLAVQFATGGEGLEGFKTERLNIAVIDRDGGSLAKGLSEYLGERHNLVDVKDDKTVIQEELFYRNIYYVVTIPEDFENACLEGTEKLETTKIPGTNSAFYVDQQIDTFLNSVRVFSEAGFSMEDAIAETTESSQEKAEVTLIDKNGHGGEVALHAFMFQFMPYVILSILCYILASVMIVYRKKDVRRRMLCSAVSSRKQNAQLVLGYLVVGLVVWGICMLLPVIISGKEFLADSNRLYYGANTFLIMLVGLSLSFTIGVLVKKDEVVNGVVNVLTLGMGFLCGVFVSMDVLGKSVKAVAQFLPVYWYETVNGILVRNVDFTKVQQAAIWKGFGIQFLFAAAILGVGLVISKSKERE